MSNWKEFKILVKDTNLDDLGLTKDEWVIGMVDIDEVVYYWEDEHKNNPVTTLTFKNGNSIVVFVEYNEFKKPQRNDKGNSDKRLDSRI